jgi:glycosyltransferase involved in cell wall biosynthesis
MQLVWLSSSLVLLSCSKTEAQPISIIEAMAYGTPFVAPRVGSIDYMRGGLSFTTFNDAVVALKKILSDSQLWHTLSAAGISAYLENHDYFSVRDRLENAVKLSLCSCHLNSYSKE